MTDTSGFYKADGDLHHAANEVLGPSFVFSRAARANFRGPSEGWGWFASRADARAHFKLPPEDVLDELGLTLVQPEDV
jgi:hypothetical protein